MVLPPRQPHGDALTGPSHGFARLVSARVQRSQRGADKLPVLSFVQALGLGIAICPATHPAYVPSRGEAFAGAVFNASC
jgi:hypothetical protein